LAYKHPTGYKNIAIPFIILISLGAIFYYFYLYGSVSYLISSLKESLDGTPNNNISSIGFKIESLYKYFNNFEYVFVVSSLSIAYLVFLIFLPNILGTQKSKKRIKAA
jgi:hypothetical protein